MHVRSCARVVCRYRVHGNMLYVRHTKVSDRGTYRCIIERPSGKMETADAPLGLYVHHVCHFCLSITPLFSTSSHYRVTRVHLAMVSVSRFLKNLLTTTQ